MAPHASHRRRRNKVVTTVAGGAAALLAVGGTLFAGSGAQASPAAALSGAQQQDFVAAAGEFHVPAPVLLGVSYEESQWVSHSGRYSSDGGYGVMNLADVTPRMVAGGSAGEAGRHELASVSANPAMHTLTTAAALIGAPASQVRDDDRQNIRAGAALLASYEKKITGGGTPSDPGQWYGAVARYSQSTGAAAARSFADAVFQDVRHGASATPGGQRMKLSADSAVQPRTSQITALHLNDTQPDPQAQCPARLDCQFAPANTANYQVANRPADGVDIRYIVIHDTESSYQAAIDSFQSPGGDAANYVIRSADGAVTQSVPNQDVAFHAGNFWFNMHAIGIEHEGFAAQGATWYTDAQYRSTAVLVRYLAAEYHIPLDREHIIGHDNVPGPQDGYVAGMHWDPGPYWDWNRFMRMLGAPVDSTPHGVGPVGSPITIDPAFADDQQTVNVCPSDDGTGSTKTCTDQTGASSILYVRTAPDASAPLVSDPYLHSGSAAGSDEISDWGSTVSAGQQFVVADRSGDWTAIWYSGKEGWIYNPDGVNTTPAHCVKVVSPASGTSTVALYGSGYPKASEYPANLSPSTQVPLSHYQFPTGQAYVATAAASPADDFFHNPPDTVVKGTESYYTIQYGHRLALVDSADVTTSAP
ncbi:N-acetylmuramoyl-L-alanine amidase [Streptomyces sp. PTM05]|uniref:N-acetylmuramoyl-L-alanine amidase n=1 Tax=Streptantibioticus parmotrematis TaxID=2873249 RepID=A0ABS7QKC6_9ACTN|nr:N-acetylmuramoyl-L-alanine amidase [Streptantibioticus parmotrematis]